jgi:hypothetical protein
VEYEMQKKDRCTEVQAAQEVRYITKGLIDGINKMNPLLYIKLWEIYDNMGKEVSEVDYLQIFEIKVEVTNKGILQKIEHRQEEPEYSKIYQFYTDRPVEEKIYIVKDGNNCVMMLASEY